MQLPPAKAPPGTVVPDVWTFTPVAASYTALGHTFLTPLLALPLGLLPLCVAQQRLWCDHDYPRWGAHTLRNACLRHPSCSAHRLLSWGRSFQSTLLRPFVLDRNICSFLWCGGGAGDGLRSDGRSPPLIQERVLYPAHRHLRAGAAGAPAFSCAW
jgi:hypothetical protein